MDNILLTPPAAFVIMLASMLIFLKLLAGLSYKRKGSLGEGAEKTYACGEESPTNMVQPDYSQFFPFAFFFTLLHVFTLTIATVPLVTLGSFAIAAIYILAAITGLVILFRR